MMLKARAIPVAIKWLGVLGALILFCVACSSAPKTTVGAEARAKDEQNAPLYYDFNDVLVPPELSLDTESSFVYHTAGLTAGVLVFTSKVERSSLVQFFENNMAKDNWQAVGSFKSARTLLIFQKETRWCVINVTENNWDTLVEIWLAPSGGQSGGGLLR